VNRAYLVLVAFDENNQVVGVPPIEPETEEEREEYVAGLRRQKLRMERKGQGY
jgi:acyl-CoA hydrolase